MSYLDKTFCASPRCKNECGRQIAKKEEKRLGSLPKDSQNVWWGYFCDERGEIIKY